MGIDEHVSFGKELAHFTTNGSDSVTVVFKDGAAVSGNLLVGADGVQSSVRKQYLPNHQPLDTGGRIIFGKTPLTSNLTDNFPSEMLQCMSMIRDPKASIPTFTLLEPIVFPPPSSRPAYPILPGDYVYWVICTQDSDLATVMSPDQSRGGITIEAATKASKQVTAHWHPRLRTLLELQDTSQASVIPISTHLPAMPIWKSVPTVTLIGDAAHVMPPTGASGCVTALRDAAGLVNMIVEKGIREGIPVYESNMRAYAGNTIERSLDAAVKGFGFKPQEEWKQANT
jgi:2-polyprenyl-6-methoxyphenol hydroxylase-like FAD-dependent oxidoreductase